jgi:hypothetical protein
MDSRGAAGPESGTARKDGTKSKPFGTKPKPDGTKTKFFGTESKSISFRESRLFNRLSPVPTEFPSKNASTAPERGIGLRPSPSAGVGRCPRIADVDRIHGEHDNAKLAFRKENVHEMFQPDSFQQNRQGAARAGFPPPVIIAILQAIKTAGALQADLVIQ